MTTPVLMTLIICLTITILLGSVLIAGVVLSKQKKQDQVDHHQQRNDFPTIEDIQKKDGKY